ncbi:3'-5' exonuclease [Lentzea sp. NPDC004789]
MADVAVDELSGDGGDSLVGYRSLLHGGKPRLAGYPNEQAEVAAIAGWVRDLIAQGIPAADVAVCARFNLTLDKVFDELTAEGIPAVRVKDQPGADVDGVRLATMHSMKGLEFRCVAVVGVTERALPFAKEITPPDVDPRQHESNLLKQRCLLFVACTRAREALAVTWSGSASPFLPAGAERQGWH